jgi:transcription-repair coupling factor (superfamily II helicase)
MFKALLATTPWPGKLATRTALGPFYGSAEARCIAELAIPGQLLLVITADTSSALALERELPFFLDRPLEILAFPDWETLPYDNFSPHQDIISERLNTLYRLPGMNEGVLIAPISTLMQRLAPTHYIAGSSLVLENGQTLDIDKFRRNLERNGYRNVDTVYEHGEFALRGSLFDIYPMGSKLPFRIDLLDSEVDSIRTFEPESQRTVERVDAIRLLPAREYPLDSTGIRRFQMNWYDNFDVDHDNCPIYAEVSAGRSPGGCEYYLPLFFENCATLFDYLPEDVAIITCGEHHSAARHFWSEANTRFEEYGIDPRRPLLPPRRCFTPVEELYQILGIFIPLITTNCVILGRAEAFAAKNSVAHASFDGLMMGTGFGLVLLAIGAVRELLGSGALFGNMQLLFGPIATHWQITVFHNYPGFLLAILPPGAFLVLGLLIALKNRIDEIVAERIKAANTSPVTVQSRRVRVTGVIE